jgi:hypothetical protein
MISKRSRPGRPRHLRPSSCAPDRKSSVHPSPHFPAKPKASHGHARRAQILYARSTQCNPLSSPAKARTRHLTGSHTHMLQAIKNFGPAAPEHKEGKK